jgi:hypothetical protein
MNGADINDDNYGYDPKKLVLWDDDAETDNHYWRMIQTGDTVRFESKAFRGMVMNCLGGQQDNTPICLWDD